MLFENNGDIVWGEVNLSILGVEGVLRPFWPRQRSEPKPINIDWFPLEETCENEDLLVTFGFLTI